MYIYLIIFLLSYALLRISQTRKSVQQRKACIMIALLLPSILAGCRDYSIGTDVKVYGNSWFGAAVNAYNFMSYARLAIASNVGIIYAVVNYFISLFTENAHWFYFGLSALTTGLTYKAAKENDDLVDVPFSMLVYYLLFYNQSLNLLRQSLAVAFVACSFKYIRKKQIALFMVYALLAIFSHSSAIVVFSMYIIYFAINGKLGLFAKGIVLGGTITVIIGFDTILQILIQAGFLSNRYAHYADEVLRGGGYVRLFLLCMPYMVLIFFCTKVTEFWKEKNVLSIFLTISTLISLLAFRYSQIVRIGLYFDICLIFTIPYIAQNCKFEIKILGKNRNRLVLTCIMLSYWILVYAIRRNHETVPYIFMR